MPSAVLYPLAVLGALTLVASAALLLLVLLDHRGRRRATHRQSRDADAVAEPTPIA